jgi:hypothetical protein
MGALHYGPQAIHFDDRTLVHLQIVINSKLQRREGFFLSWFADENGRDARRSIWLSHTVPLAFAFETARVGAIDRAWLDDLEVRANTGAGLFVTPEPNVDRPPVLKRQGASAR